MPRGAKLAALRIEIIPKTDMNGKTNFKEPICQKMCYLDATDFKGVGCTPIDGPAWQDLHRLFSFYGVEKETP